MLRLFVTSRLEPGTVLRLGGAEVHHLRVCRLTAGDELRLVGEGGEEHAAVVEEVRSGEAAVRIGAPVTGSRESALELVLAPALTRGPRMDLVIEKATEIGVTRIAPVLTRHVVTHAGHVERWKRVALAAAKQSGRTRVPEVAGPVPLAELAAAPWPGLRLVAWEREDARRFATLPDVAAAVVALVGPEGGFAAEEIAAATAHGFVPISLGPRTLRAETGAIVVAALCQARWGDG